VLGLPRAKLRENSGLGVMVVTNLTLAVLCYRVIAAGWRLKP
jgi:hypothetical protein